MSKFFLLICLVIFSACHKTQENEIQREEVNDYNQSEPLSSDEEIEYEREMLNKIK